MRVILFVCVFLFTLSCLFSVEDKFLDMDRIFMVKKKAIIVYVTGSLLALIVAILYDSLIY